MKVFLRTFGCRANAYDSAAVRAMLESAGHEVVADAADADLAVVNSCAVTADAEADARQAIRRAARERPGIETLVMGCAATTDREPALRALSGVRHVVAGADLVTIARALDLPPESARAGATAQAGTRAMLRVQDGCDEHCTFCATSLARGANRSRAVDALVDEATRLAERHPELVITGTHIGSWGADSGATLGALVEALVTRVPAVRFRLSSLEATEVDDRLRGLMRDAPERVAPHLHAPLQSGSDRLLKRMGRHWYTAATYAAAVERLAGDCPVLGLGADVIAGFPGETAADHAATVALVEALPFTYLHVFPYSPRPGTAAPRLPDQVAPALARERAAELRALAERKAAAHRAARNGGVADVVVEGSTPERRVGLTEDYLTVSLADPAIPRGVRLGATLRLVEGRLVAHRSD